MAEEPPRSECLAMANAPLRATPVSLRRVAGQKADQVTITYAGPFDLFHRHARRGAGLATDYSGAYQIRPAAGRRHHEYRAHSTHYTLFPDPAHSPCAARLGATTASPQRISITRIGDVR